MPGITKAASPLLFFLAVAAVCQAQSNNLVDAARTANPAKPGVREEDPWSIQYAARHHQLSVISTLIGMGFDVNAQGSDGNRALDIACLQGDAPITRLLLEHGADPNLRNKTGSTPLHDAALNGNKEVIDLLLAHNANMNAIADADGSTPLHYAASMDRLEAAETLVHHGADVTLKNAKGQTAIQLAAKNGFTDISEFLAQRVPPRQ